MTASVRRNPSPPFTDEHEALRAEIRRFVAEELRPHAGEWEAAEWFPNDVFHRMAELGLLGLKYPVEYGGRGGGGPEDAGPPEGLRRPGARRGGPGGGAAPRHPRPPAWEVGPAGP